MVPADGRVSYEGARVCTQKRHAASHMCLSQARLALGWLYHRMASYPRSHPAISALRFQVVTLLLNDAAYFWLLKRVASSMFNEWWPLKRIPMMAWHASGRHCLTETSASGPGWQYSRCTAMA
jgi:hypothetical protein